ncbi:MAG: hypothetical protein IKM76_04265 [Prevotella sp.]|nr:hypothetical protein [Prevotella sp.]
MKKKLFIVVCALLGVLAASAQQKLVIKLENGERLTYETWQVDSLYFTAGETIATPVKTDPVNLGFAKWSVYNFGATTESETGLLVGWADVTGTNRSTKLKYFPGENYTKSINETDYDIVHARWGGEWRMPTTEDIQMLKDSCTWTYEEVNDVPGWRLTSKKDGYTDQSIFLPFTGYRKGDAAAVATGEKGLYWTGIIGDDTQKAKAMLLTGTDTDTLTVVDSLRYMGFAIRPVYGKIVHPLQFTSVVVMEGTLKYSSVSILATTLGDMTGVDKIYICLGPQSEALVPETAAYKFEETVSPNKTEFQFNIDGLDPNTAYKCLVYLDIDDQRVMSDSCYFETAAKFPVAEAVDLGLSVDWASWNIGESTPSGNTHLYGWGDVTGELTSTIRGHYAVGLPEAYDVSIAGNESYDIAAKQWRNGWRMPTKAEIDELYSGCNITLVSVNGVTGYRFTNKQDANKSIFIPVSGMRYGTTVHDSSTPYYWTANGVSEDGQLKGVNAQLLPSSYAEQHYPRFWGMAIRPVKVKDGSNTGGNTGGGSGTSGGGNTGGNTSGDTGGNTGGNSGTISSNVGTAVDLGLSSGTKWSNHNLGAATATDCGGYYAWGDLEPRTDNFGRDDYQYYDTSTGTFAKFANGYICGNASYEAATAAWGSSWHMPSSAQVQELINSCTWTWKTNYQNSGMSGYEVKGQNNNTIFLPAGGDYHVLTSNTELTQQGTIGRYWTGNVYNTINITSWQDAYLLQFTQEEKFANRVSRWFGCTIRPVQGGQ